LIDTTGIFTTATIPDRPPYPCVDCKRFTVSPGDTVITFIHDHKRYLRERAYLRCNEQLARDREEVTS